MHWLLLLSIAVVSDTLDFVGGAAPIIGDVLDLTTVAILFPYLGVQSGIGLVELVPGADVFPTYTALALWRILQAYREQGHLARLDIPRKYDVPGRDTL